MIRVHRRDGDTETHQANRADIAADGSLLLSWVEIKQNSIMQPGQPPFIQEVRLVKIYVRDLWLEVVSVEEPGDALIIGERKVLGSEPS